MTPPILSAAYLPAAILLAFPSGARAQDGPPLSEATESCLFCHETLHPGIVADWKKSRHARTTVREALAKDHLERRVSVDAAPEGLGDVAIGCAECHTVLADSHPDTVRHQGHAVHVVVSPRDCALCHPVEVGEYGQNLMAHARDNLRANPLFADLAQQINGAQSWDGERLTAAPPHAGTDAASRDACHGTKVEILRTEKRKTGLGEMEFAVLSGWPNQGVGRVNPDGSRGACTACHTRHRFSLEVARKPYSCAQCHKGPDVPAYPVNMASKHGNIYASEHHEWDFDAVPWVPGRDFSVPTCAACHMSLLATADGDVIQKRTHRINDRLFTRLFGLPYAHAHPTAPETWKLRNAEGLPLPSSLSGESAPEGLIDRAEQGRRSEAMQAVCRACHSRSWVAGHFDSLDLAIRETNARTRAATRILLSAWESKAATGPDGGGSPFDEHIERLWVEQWLFHANSIRFAAAMMGADYGVFANGRWQAAKGLREMEHVLAASKQKANGGARDGDRPRREGENGKSP